MNVWAIQQTAETIAERYRNMQPMSAQLQARCDKDTADYKAERRLKAVKRYLRERAAR